MKAPALSFGTFRVKVSTMALRRAYDRIAVKAAREEAAAMAAREAARVRRERERERQERDRWMAINSEAKSLLFDIHRRFPDRDSPLRSTFMDRVEAIMGAPSGERMALLGALRQELDTL